MHIHVLSFLALTLFGTHPQGASQQKPAGPKARLLSQNLCSFPIAQLYMQEKPKKGTADDKPKDAGKKALRFWNVTRPLVVKHDYQVGLQHT